MTAQSLDHPTNANPLPRLSQMAAFHEGFLCCSYACKDRSIQNGNRALDQCICCALTQKTFPCSLIDRRLSHHLL